MNHEIKAVCFTGHRTLPTGQNYNLLKQRLQDAIEQAITQGYDYFYVGGAMGWDLLAAECVLKLQEKSPITLIAVLPFPNHESKFPPKDWSRYHRILPYFDEVITLSESYHKDCYKERNQYMVDCSLCTIAYWDGAFRSGTGQTVRMAERKGIPVLNLYVPEFCD